MEAHLAIVENATKKKKKDMVILPSAPAAKNGKYASIDPDYGNNFVSACCLAKLSNKYNQCNGCFTLLSMEYNLCHDCYSDEAHHLRHKERSHLLIPDVRCSSVNHFIGETEKCCCKSKKEPCLDCKKCPWCVCGCHKINHAALLALWCTGIRFIVEGSGKSCTWPVYGAIAKFLRNIF